MTIQLSRSARCAGIVACSVTIAVTASSAAAGNDMAHLTFGNAAFSIPGDPVTESGVLSLADTEHHDINSWWWFRTGWDDHESPLAVPEMADVIGGNRAIMGVIERDFSWRLSVTLEESVTPGSYLIRQELDVFNDLYEPLELTLFHMMDPALLSQADNDRAFLTTEPGVIRFQTDGAEGVFAGADPSARMLGLDGSLREALNDDGITTLEDALAPVGPGDVEAAMAWTATIAAESSARFTSVFYIPSPGAATALALGVLGACARRRR